MKTEKIDFDFYDDGVRQKPTRRLCITKGENSVRLVCQELVYMSDNSEMVMCSTLLGLPRQVVTQLVQLLKDVR